MNNLPEKIAYNLYKVLNFPNEPQYVQVATSSDDKIPSLRTMKLVKLTSNGYLYLLSNVQTKKWEDLKSNNRIEICLFDKPNQLQIKASGIVALESNSKSQEIINLWQKVRVDVKQAISQSSGESELFPPANFGLICVKPTYWEILILNSAIYAKSQRVSYILKDTQWEESKLAVIS